MLFKGEMVFVRLLLPVIAGIVTGFYVSSGEILKWTSMGAVLLFFVFVYFWIFYIKLKLYLNKWIPGLFINLFLFLLSLSLTLIKNDALSSSYFLGKKGEVLVLTVASEPAKAKGIIRFEADVHGVAGKQGLQNVCGKLLIALKPDSRENRVLNYGDRLLVPYHCTEVEPPRNPFEFDYKQYLAHRGITQQAFLRSEQVRVVDHNKGNRVVAFAYRLRQKLVRGFTRYIPDKEAAALASTLILGYKAELSPEIITAYSKTGTMHVLSVSGMHLLLVFSIFTLLLSFLDKSQALKLVKVILIIAAVWFYALLTGFSSAVCRAALMCSIYVIGKTFSRKTNAYNTLAASALLLLFYNPCFLLDSGFQLSYLAVLGLVYLYPKLYHLFYFRNYVADKVWSMTAVSIAAQLATLPLSLYYFHQFPLYFLISNLFIILPVELLMYTGILFLLLFSLKGFVPEWLLKFTGEILNEGICFMNKGLVWIQDLSGSSLIFYPYGAFYYSFLFFAILILLTAIQFRQKKYVFLSAGMFLALVCYSSWNQIQRSRQKQIIFYSLRKNQAVGFFNGSKVYLLSDLKAEEKAYSFFVKPSIDAFADDVYRLDANADKFPGFYQHNCIGFYNWKMIVWDKSLNARYFNKSLNVNVVLLSENPDVNLKTLTRYLRFSLLLIDASNKDYRIKRWEQEAKELKLKYYILKRNQALRIDLKSGAL